MFWLHKNIKDNNDAIWLIMFNIVSVSMSNMELEGDREEKSFDIFFSSTVTLIHISS